MTFYTNSAIETEEVGRKLAEALEKGLDLVYKEFH